MADRLKLPSRVLTEGLERAPHRAFLRAVGLDNRSVALAAPSGTMTPCTMALPPQIAAAREGIEAAGGTVFDAPTRQPFLALAHTVEGQQHLEIARRRPEPFGLAHQAVGVGELQPVSDPGDLAVGGSQRAAQLERELVGHQRARHIGVEIEAVALP